MTLRLGLDYTADSSPAVVYLDEVSVGSTYPDAWVEAAGPRSVLPGQQAVYTLTYGNHGAAEAADVAVSYSLPAALALVSADPAPSSVAPLTWNVGELPAHSGPFTITLTLRADPLAGLGWVGSTAQIQTQSTELEQANNSVAGSVFVGSLTYLPAAHLR